MLAGWLADWLAGWLVGLTYTTAVWPQMAAGSYRVWPSTNLDEILPGSPGESQTRTQATTPPASAFLHDTGQTVEPLCSTHNLRGNLVGLNITHPYF
jgi:hypothetical protein